MDAAQLFGVANLLALSAWLTLAVALLAPHGASWAVWVGRWGGWGVPVLLSLLYVASFWAGRHAPGGFESLSSVHQLFQEPKMLLAGWVHYLAFDLFVGYWQVRQARQHGFSLRRRWIVLPCLAATFWVGPLGLLLFLLVHGTQVFRGDAGAKEIAV